MAKNRKYEDGEQLTLPVIAGTVSGSPVIVGMLPGVALIDRDANGNATVQVGDGVFTVTVTATANITIGQPIYITSATYALSDAAGAGKQLFGHAYSTSTGAGSKSVDVRIAHFAVAVDTPA
jgi:predicted RecA/RadA family phage recombinase